MMSKSTVPVAIDLLQAGVVIGLGEVDPFDRGAGVGLPRLQEAAEQEVVQVLVVEAHEGEIDALEFAGLNIGLGRPEAELANLLPVGVGRRAVAGARDLHDLGDNAVLGVGRAGRKRQRTAGRQRRGGACSAFHKLAPAGLHRHQLFVDMYTHNNSSHHEVSVVTARFLVVASISARLQTGALCRARLAGFKTKGPSWQVNRRPLAPPRSAGSRRPPPFGAQS